MKKSLTSQLYLTLCLGAVLAYSLASGASPAPAIRIISPRDYQIVPIGDVTVEVAADNFVFDSTHHWHLYLDGAMVTTVQDGATRSTLKVIKSGPHTIKAALADGDHGEVASAEIEVTAAPATPSRSPFNVPYIATVMFLILVGVLALLVVALRVGPRNRPG